MLYRAILINSFLITVLSLIALPAHATLVHGIFSGTIYTMANGGGDLDIPIDGTFDYDTSLFTASPCGGSYCSLFAPTASNAIAITQHSSLGDFTFTNAGNFGFWMEKDQINFGAFKDTAFDYSNYTSMDVLFPSQIFALGSIPTTYSAILVPYQGSNSNYYDGQGYFFYITKISASPYIAGVSSVPLPGTVVLFGTALIVLAGMGYGRRYKAVHIN